MSADGVYRIQNDETKAKATQRAVFEYRIDSTIKSLKSCKFTTYPERPGKFYLLANDEQAYALFEFCVVNNLELSESYRKSNLRGNFEIYPRLLQLFQEKILNETLKSCKLATYPERPGQFYLLVNDEQKHALSNFCIINGLKPSESYRISAMKGNIEIYKDLRELLTEQIFPQSSPKRNCSL